MNQSINFVVKVFLQTTRVCRLPVAVFVM